MSTFVNYNGSWKQAKELWVNQNGIWVKVKEAYVNQNGTWQKTFSSGPLIDVEGGDLVYDIPGYRVHVFTTVGSAPLYVNANPDNVPFEYLVVGGGGGRMTSVTGGYGVGSGGGGGGQVLTGSTVLPLGQTTVEVGAGGVPLFSDIPAPPAGSSKLGSTISYGGGSGSGNWTFNGNGKQPANGSSGGGGTSLYGPNPGTPGQGFGGGSCADAVTYGGGGGGASSAGLNGTGSLGGNGGKGIKSDITGELLGYGGGGAGNSGTNGLGVDTAGQGFDGGGWSDPTTPAPRPNSGGGVGGANSSAEGAAGIVVIRYPR